uniref:LOW QUALITY PROTEIN: RAB6A-GEF complex partner protein 2-like n=1 Tax=Styela clava TaxID=7725 RepID=UPI0019397B32|nr:LOW QUALITY PROTEIN: RAB6A-GEF complex partner protein 2-like [Styela clava]
MIEVTARLARGSAYFAGEPIKCLLTFKNVGNPKDPMSESPKKTSAKADTLAWASAQIACFCSVSGSRVIMPESLSNNMMMASQEVKMQHRLPHKEEHGRCVLQTNIKILFCDLRLMPGELKHFCFNDVIPSHAFPSYRGPSVKYSYKITIAMQRVGAPVRVLRVPLRVLVLYGVTEFKVEDEPLTNSLFIPTPEPTNLLDIASEILSTITSRKNSHNYKIANTSGTITVFTLLKGSVRLGEDIVGMFDFSSGTVPCVQFTVCLQSEEEISEECQRHQDVGNAILSYEKHTQYCLFLKKTHIAVPVPLHSTPGFLTDLVCLKWRLHFEFVVSKGPLKKVKLDPTQSDDCMWQGPSHLETDTVSWDLPVRILPTMPMQAESSGCTMNSYSLTI